MSSAPTIVVATYSTWGHINQMSAALIKGLESAGAQVKQYRFEETLSDEVRAKMHAAPAPELPALTPDDLKGIDGLVIGGPTRYGRVPAQISTFFDRTGGLWASGGLVGVPVTQFSSAATLHGGHEVSNVKVVHGASPYGSSTVAGGDGSLQPQKEDLAAAEYQGKYFAGVAAALKKGRAAA